MKIRTITAIKHNGAEVPIGSTLEVDESDREAVKEFDRLVRLKAAEVVESDDPKDDNEPGETKIKPGHTHLNSAIEELCELDGVESDIAQRLIDAGFTTVKDVYEADSAALVKIKGIGEKSCIKIQESAETIIEKNDPDYFED